MERPFDAGIHIKSPYPDTDDRIKILKSFRQNLSEYHPDLCAEFALWLTEEQLIRFLIARNYDLAKSVSLIVEAMNWRRMRKPHLLESMKGVGSTDEHWSVKFSKECETGKIYNPGFDQYNRPFIVFDNTVQNTHNVDDHMLFLAWSLEFAIRQMTTVDKYCIFVHLENFSIFKCPPLKSVRETLLMLGGSN